MPVDSKVVMLDSPKGLVSMVREQDGVIYRFNSVTGLPLPTVCRNAQGNKWIRAVAPYASVPNWQEGYDLEKTVDGRVFMVRKIDSMVYRQELDSATVPPDFLNFAAEAPGEVQTYNPVDPKTAIAYCLKPLQSSIGWSFGLLLIMVILIIIVSKKAPAFFTRRTMLGWNILVIAFVFVVLIGAVLTRDTECDKYVYLLSARG